MFVFVYGSLMSPRSLRTVLPDVLLDACIPARCSGHRRTFGVAFPNDGSETDKAYFDASGVRPPIILFCDMPRDQNGWLNGVCVPVDNLGIASLKRRELRYDFVEVTDRVAAYDSSRMSAPTFAFIGADRYTAPEDLARGVLPQNYLDTVREGATSWESRCPGFLADFDATTQLPGKPRIADLRRVDAANGHH